MSVVNGQVANQTTFNTAFMSRTAASTSTAAIVSLLNVAVASGASVNNVQALLNKLIEGLGTTGELDATINDYASNNYVTDGDDRKEAIEALDSQLGSTQAQLDAVDAANSSDITLAPIGVVPSAEGATLSGQTLTLQPADAAYGGIVTALAQVYAGLKTFNNGVTLKGASEGTIGHVWTSTDIAGAGAWAAVPSAVPTYAFQAKTANYTILATDTHILADATAGIFTLTFPSAASATNKIITCKKIDSSFNRVTLSGTGLTTNYLHTQGETASFLSDGTTWNQVYRKTDTDWIAFTPTAVNFTLGNEGSFWRRTGDSLDLFYQFTDSAGVAASASVRIPNPSGWTISSTKTTASAQNAWKVGEFHFPGAGTSIPSTTDGPFVAFTDLAVSNLDIYFGLTSTGSRFAKRNGNALTTGGRIVMRVYSIPITDFSA